MKFNNLVSLSRSRRISIDKRRRIAASFYLLILWTGRSLPWPDPAQCLRRWADPTPANLVEADFDSLRACGFSSNKIATIKAIAAGSLWPAPFARRSVVDGRRNADRRHRDYQGNRALDGRDAVYVLP
jgi:hypothetical protein